MRFEATCLTLLPMKALKSSNPFLVPRSIERSNRAQTVEQAQRMTIEGTMSKILVLIMLAMVTASLTWANVHNASATGVVPGVWKWMTPAWLVSLVLLFIAYRKPEKAPILAPVTALAMGVSLGAVSAMYQLASFPGIVPLAMALTFGTAISMFIIWRTGLVKVTNKFMSVVTALFGAMFFIFIMAWFMRMFDMEVGFIYGNGPVAIGFSIVVIIVSALMLMVDFEQISRAEKQGAPAYYEWFFGISVLVTLVWLYYSFLRLINALRD